MEASEAENALLNVFGCLHDGTLEGVRGDVPGLVVLRIEIEYLAEALSPGETTIDVILEECRVATFELYKGPGRASLTEEPSIGWTILRAQRGENDVVEVNCAEGFLRLSCGSVRLQLGSTRALSIGELRRAASDGTS